MQLHARRRPADTGTGRAIGLIEPVVGFVRGQHRDRVDALRLAISHPHHRPEHGLGSPIQRLGERLRASEDATHATKALAFESGSDPGQHRGRRKDCAQAGLFEFSTQCRQVNTRVQQHFTTVIKPAKSQQ